MKRMTQKMITAIMLLGVICAIFTGCGKNSGNTTGNEGNTADGWTESKPVNTNVLNFNDYVRFDIEGTNGYGILDNVYIDYKQIVTDYTEKFESLQYEILEESEDFGLTVLFFSNTYEEGITTHGYDLKDAYNVLVRDLSPTMDYNTFYQFSENEHLKNGTKIKINWLKEDYVKENVKKLEKLLDVKISYKDFTFTINNLSEVVEVDPFADVEFQMVGNSGEAYFYSKYALANVPTLQGNMETAIVLDITEENNMDYSNGDKVRAYLQEAVDVDRIAREYGVIFTRTEGEIEISGLNAYGRPEASDGEHAIINLNDYIYVGGWYEFDGYGSAQISIDYEAIIRDYRKSISTNIAPEDMLGSGSPRFAAKRAFEYHDPFAMISTSHDYYCSGGGYTELGNHLCNGDVLKMSWEVNQEGLDKLTKIMNAEFVYEDFEIMVSGLKPVREFDPFETYELFFDGSNGSGYAYGSIIFNFSENDPHQMMDIEFEVISDKNGSLSNGDTIILSVEYFEQCSNFLFNWGLIPTRTEIEVVVSGLE